MWKERSRKRKGHCKKKRERCRRELGQERYKTGQGEQSKRKET
jgi:hypothetical protein